LGGGPPLQGELMDVGGGGVRVALDRSLPSEEIVRVFFPRKSNVGRQPGRMIIGHVVHSESDAGRYIVRIAYGWDAAVPRTASPIRKDSESSSLFRPFSRKLKSWLMSALRTD
jgi:hypothetical protein